jgi:hypothetical protein
MLHRSEVFRELFRWKQIELPELILDAGVTCVGIGSGLFPEEMIEKSDWKGLSARVQILMNNLKTARTGYSV